ncbi:hypothetical protein [Flavobacterium nackdongense]|uniref:Uncharacterized protein n=1 Tax=Flavobacterium nackdongense TaxID=2547394 RepID=A0A4P6YEW1_9FLAO|nr:hypothetical protein [Flavobacterium nackdongense]QBN18963.1 hypothetical protein E1750_09155 [Flavobacterium nackdongense]
METLLINTKNSSNAKFILELVKKLGEEGRILSAEQQEDYFLGAMILNEKTGEKVSRNEVFEKLNKK